ncbi:hypothetical protein ACEPPN_019204 [Leptodophora sp. 'Broadleaf-Isolate-01']
MRLLQSDGDGNPSLTEFFEDDIPEYAILSHRWEAEEATFKDLRNRTGTNKAGYKKIRFCGEQARRDGLKYFWVDTCCIDKSSSAELSEAINSMFRWYHKSAVCYVYLSDVLRTAVNTDDLAWESAFQNSKWFTRGWTLQELLAPRLVEFFSREGNRLGNKGTLGQQIHEITGIPTTALREYPLSQFDVDERFSWAKSRQTTRGEDKAYSLFGIFDVQMPLLYGKGEVKAFQRLREAIDKPFKGPEKDLLRHLPYADEAPFNSYNRQHESTCLPKTRVDLLQEIYGWCNGNDKPCIFWLNGLAGTGKSTIARTIARRYSEQGHLGASFFFSRGGGDVGHAGKFVTSIALQLASSIPSLDQHICDALTERRDIASRSLRDQWQQLVLRPLSKLGESGGQATYVLVVEALDECEDDDNVGIIVQLFSETRSLKTVRLRVFLTSRPETTIRNGFIQMPDIEHQDFVLHNISSSIVDRDIRTFLEHDLQLIARGQRFLTPGWPGEEILKRLVQGANGLFIWAATACRFIRNSKFTTKSLDLILVVSSTSINAPEKHLDEIYITVLRNCIQMYPNEAEELLSMLKSLLGTIITLVSPLSIQSLSKLLCATQVEVDQTLNDLHAILSIPEDHNLPLRLHHPSFRDFLYGQARCEEFWVDERQAHQVLADKCIQLMSASLKQDICGMEAPNMLFADAERSRIEQSLPLEVQYACHYWIDHVQKSGTQLRDNGQVHRFLKEHFLHWVEALAWIGQISKGIYATASLESYVATYSSALVFTPFASIVRQQFEGRIPEWMRVLPKVEEEWGSLIQTLHAHSEPVNAVAFSSDGTLLASASDDCTVELWDTRSGIKKQTLSGHSRSVMAVAFSSNGALLASASVDNTVKLWDVRSGVEKQTLKSHSGPVSAVAFSLDDALLASASHDNTVKLWDTRSGVEKQTFHGHSMPVNAIAFSSDDALLASASHDYTVKLWDVRLGAKKQTLEGHSRSVNAVAFSSNGTLLASASSDCTIKLWDSRLGTEKQTLKGHSGSVTALAFSSDGAFLASASFDKTVKLWDVRSAAEKQTFNGHSAWVMAVAFSSDDALLASASHDCTVKLWDVRSAAEKQTLDGHSESVEAMVFSSDGALLASASDDCTVKLWDARSGAEKQTLCGHSRSVKAVAFSSNGALLASASADIVKLWDTRSGAEKQTFKHVSWVTAVAFSSSGALLASAEGDSRRVMLWDAREGADSVPLVSILDKKLFNLWDTHSKAEKQMLQVDAIVSTFLFSGGGRYWHTNREKLQSMTLPTDTSALHPSPTISIFVKERWVSYNTKKALWFPSEYAPHVVAVHGSTVSIGCASGRVYFMGFDFSDFSKPSPHPPP